jgi:hypothetical protein
MWLLPWAKSAVGWFVLWLVLWLPFAVAIFYFGYRRWKRDNRHYVLWDDGGHPGGEVGRAMAIVLDCLTNGRTKEEAALVLERSGAAEYGAPILDRAWAGKEEAAIFSKRAVAGSLSAREADDLFRVQALLRWPPVRQQ